MKHDSFKESLQNSSYTNRRLVSVSLLLLLLLIASEGFALDWDPGYLENRLCKQIQSRVGQMKLAAQKSPPQSSLKSQKLIDEFITLTADLPPTDQKFLGQIKSLAQKRKLPESLALRIMKAEDLPQIYHCDMNLYSYLFTNGLNFVSTYGTEEQKHKFKKILLTKIIDSTKSHALTLHLVVYLSSIRNLMAQDMIPREFDRKIYNLRQDARIIIEEHSFRNYKNQNRQPTQSDINLFIFDDFRLSNSLREDIKNTALILNGQKAEPRVKSDESFFAKLVRTVRSFL